MKLLMMLLLAGTFSASCSKSNNEPKAEPDISKGFITGKLADANGNPVAGVEVVASHSTYYNTTATAQTDENGHYKLNVANPKGNWTVEAQVVRIYNGKTYRFYVYPENGGPITHDGAVRNFSWKLTGQVPGAHSDIRVGGYITYMDDNANYIPENEIEFTLVPEGKLVDGTNGVTITKRAEQFPETYNYMFSNSGIRDVPVGRYRISARHLPPNGIPKKLLLSVRYSGVFAETISADFEQEAAQTWQEIPILTKSQP
jgi:hypothetical protein